MAFLIDTSVWLRHCQPTVRTRLEHLVDEDAAWTCRMIDLEMIFGARARSVPEMASARRIMLTAPITPEVLERSMDVIAGLASRGTHRGVKPADLIIAAAAEAVDLVVLHYDRDFDRIAEVTGQPMEWVAPAGSLS